MGTPIDPIEPILGDECAHFGVPAETPHMIYVYFWDILPCPAAPKPPPNMHLFALTQDPESPCLWEYENLVYGFNVILDIRTTTPMTLELRDNALNLYFQGQLWAEPAEHQVFTNLWEVCPPGIEGHFGFATLFWKAAAVKLLDDLSLPTDAKVLMEFFVTDDHEPVYKFCVPDYGMNVKILLSP